MSRIRIFAEDHPETVVFESNDQKRVASKLGSVGVRFEQWPVDSQLKPGTPPAEIITAYREQIDQLMEEEGYTTVDVVSLNHDHPQKTEMRQKFLNEHTHSEDEVRFFVGGSGLFTLHIEGKVYEVLCEAGDLIGVPDNTRHWFDMGPEPYFIAIRLFTNPDGWVAQFTGSDIASRFPRYENGKAVSA